MASEAPPSLPPIEPTPYDAASINEIPKPSIMEENEIALKSERKKEEGKKEKETKKSDLN